jgi:hypothetical protein
MENGDRLPIFADKVLWNFERKYLPPKPSKGGFNT